MHISVTPLQKTRSESYTYTVDKAAVGDLVGIELGSQKTLGVVRGEAPARKAKPAIQFPGFALTKTQYQLAEWLSEEYLTHPGIAFKQFAPPDKECLLPVGPATQEKAPNSNRPNVQLLTSQGRTKVYRSLIAQSEGPVLILVPTRDHIEPLREAVAQNALVFHSSLATAQRRDIWNQVAGGSKEVVIGTRGALHLPWSSIGLIIVEGEESMGYKQDSQPRYQTRAVASKLAWLSGADIVFGSSAPSLETFAIVQPSDDAPLNIQVQPIPPRRGDGALSYRIWNALTEASEKDSAVAWVAPHLLTEAEAELKKLSATHPVLPAVNFLPVLPNQIATIGIIAGIDPLLHLADFRASERVYEICRKTASLLKPGSTLYIQTNEAAHPMFEAIKAPMESFYLPELAERRALLLPPSIRLTRILFTSRSADVAEEAAWAAKRTLGELASDVGPCPERKRGNLYRWQVLCKGDPKSLHGKIKADWNVDVDPVDLL